MSAETEYTRDRDDTTPRERYGSSLTSWVVGALVVIALAVLAVVALVAWTDEGDSEGPDVGVTLNDVVNDPEEYVGTTVTVSGEVSEAIGPEAVAIGGDEFFGGGELLVVSVNQLPFPEGVERDQVTIAEDDLLQVTGTVAILEAEDVEDDEIGEEYAFLYEDEAFNEFEGGAILLADTVNVTPRLSPLGEAAVSVSDIAEDPAEYEGLNVQLAGEVELLLDDNVFMITEDGQTDDVVATEGNLVVAVPEGAMPEDVIEGALVQVEGTVYEFDDADVAEFGDDFGYLEDDAYDTFEGDGILIANTVEVGPQTEHIDLESVITAPDTYLGTVVTVTGQVEETLDEQAFVMTSDDEDTVVDTEMLVIASDGVFNQATIVDDAFVRVTGEVLLFDEEESVFFEEEDEEIFFDDELFDDYDGELVIVAEAIGVER